MAPKITEPASSDAPRLELHAHSNASDGRQSPAELLALAADAGLYLLALTDHDTLVGLAAARAAAARHGIQLLPGVEISTSWHGHSVHLLGYFPVNWELESEQARDFAAWLERSRSLRRERNARLAENFRRAGIPLDAQALEAERRRAGGHQIGRPHIARWLVEHGHAASIADAFGRFLTPGAATYTRLEGLPTAEAIARLRAAGGFACLAHPCRLKFAWRERLGELAAAGLDALEVFYPQHSPVQTSEFEALARQHRLALSGGSDFHGRPDDRLAAISLPRELLAEWRISVPLPPRSGHEQN